MMKYMKAMVFGAVMFLAAALLAMVFGVDASDAGFVGAAAGATSTTLLCALLTEKEQHRKDTTGP